MKCLKSGLSLKKIFLNYLITIVLCAFFNHSNAETRHIHLLKILDSENSDYIIREACSTVSLTMDKEIQLMKQYLGVLTVHTYEITGSNFTRDELLKKVDYELSYLEGDIVIVVYVGHGFRSPDMKSIAPMLYLNSYDESVSFLDIQQIIMEKRPSVLMSIVLACNKTQTIYNQPPDIISIDDPFTPDLRRLMPKGLTPIKYRELFREIPNQIRCIDLFGADKEYYTFISQNGGIFFNEILMVMQEAFAQSNFSSWNEICKAIKTRTLQKLAQRSITAQQPFCSYYLSFYPLVVGERPQQLLDKHYIKQTIKELKRKQKLQLHELRKLHRSEMKVAKKNKKDKQERHIIALQHKSSLQTLKAKHKNDLLRLKRGN